MSIPYTVNEEPHVTLVGFQEWSVVDGEIRKQIIPELSRQLVGHCKDCRFWGRRDSDGQGLCRKINGKSEDAFISYEHGVFFTQESFGCTLFEQKDV